MKNSKANFFPRVLMPAAAQIWWGIVALSYIIKALYNNPLSSFEVIVLVTGLVTAFVPLVGLWGRRIVAYVWMILLGLNIILGMLIESLEISDNTNVMFYLINVLFFLYPLLGLEEDKKLASKAH